MTIKFVTIVPHIENLELRKDTGQIPYQFHKILNGNSTLVSYYYSLNGGRKKGPLTKLPIDDNIITQDYPHLKTEVSGLNLHFLENKGRGRFYEKAILDYIRLNAKQIDILNLFHFSSENIFYTLFYKWKNPKGKVYLKLDIDISFYKGKKNFINIGQKVPVLGKVLAYIITRLFFKSVALITAESNVGLSYFKDRFNPPPQKLQLLPNGVDKERILKLVKKVRPFEEKENIILTVGRIGNIQKNTSFLLNAITKIDLKDWKLYLVGPVEQEFEPEIKTFFKKNPKLEDKVIFTGAITDPKDLYEYYNRAKVFCLPSICEGFPLAACEALFFGCYPLLSNKIHGAADFCPGNSSDHLFGIEDTMMFCNLLSRILNEEKLIKDDYLKTIEHADHNFIWQNNIQKLAILNEHI